MTVKSAQDALITLQQRTNFFHLIVTDVHMPEMDGFEFQKKVREKFNLPVVSKYYSDLELSHSSYLSCIEILLSKPTHYQVY